MAQSDFLADGQPVPEGSALKSVTSQTVLPEWYTNYAMDLLSSQKAAAAQPYQTYQGPRVAGFTPTQQQGFDMAKTAAGSYQPFLSSASSIATSATGAGSGGLAAAQGYYDQARGMDPLATAQPGFNTAREGLQAATSFNPANAASSDFGAARESIGRAGNFNPLTQAQPFVNQATGMSGLDAAMPWLDRAGNTVEDVSSYMNPYEQDVVDYIGEQGARNLSEKLMPAIEGRYIAGGQWGNMAAGQAPSGYMTDTVRAVRDTSRDILGQQAQLRQSGYVNAQNAKAGDLSRFAGIGQTVGGLTQAQQEVLLRGGQMLGGFEQANQAAALDAGRLQTSMGSAMGGFEQARMQAQLEASQAQADIAAREAGLVQGQQSLLAGMGTNAGSLAGADASRALDGAEFQSGLGALAQSLGLKGADAVAGIGGQEQALNQKNLETAYGDYLRQQGWPQEQIDKALATFKGVAPGIPTGSTEQGIIPVGTPNGYEPSTAAKIAAGLTGGAALVKELGNIF